MSYVDLSLCSILLPETSWNIHEKEYFESVSQIDTQYIFILQNKNKLHFNQIVEID